MIVDIKDVGMMRFEFFVEVDKSVQMSFIISMGFLCDDVFFLKFFKVIVNFLGVEFFVLRIGEQEVVGIVVECYMIKLCFVECIKFI